MRSVDLRSVDVESATVDSIDLNADVAESFGRWRLGDDEALFAVVTSANVACGFHAGDPPTLRRACELAVANRVSVGAQVSYRDLAGFGRRFIEMAPADLRDDVAYQLAALDGLAVMAGTAVAYVKPHGALYHAVVDHAGQSEAVVEAVAAYGSASGRPLAVLGPPGSALLAAAERAGLVAVAEAFADRGYTPQGALVPRSQPGALLTDPAEVAARAVMVATRGEVIAVDGSVLAMAAASICVHGDTPGAAGLAGAVRAALRDAGVIVAAFRR